MPCLKEVFDKSFQNDKVLRMVERWSRNSHKLESYLFQFIINTFLNTNMALMTHIQSSIIPSSVYVVFACNQVFIITSVQFVSSLLLVLIKFLFSLFLPIFQGH